MSSVFPITDDPRYRRYTASAGQTVFPIPFPFLQDEDLKICLQVESGEYEVLDQADYQLSGANDPAGGAVTLNSGRSAGDVILVLGEAILDRMSSVVRDGRFSSFLIDSELDRIRIIEQEFRRDNQRSLKVDFGGTPLTIDAGLADGETLMKQGDRLVAGPDIVAIGDEVENAKSLIEGWASDIISQGNVPIYASVVGMSALSVPVGINAIRVNGYRTPGDDGGALYVKVEAEPVHAGKFATADGAWWELRETEPALEMFGAYGDGAANDTAARDAAVEYVGYHGRVRLVEKKSYLVANAENPFAVSYVGNGSLVTSVTGGLRQRNRYSDSLTKHMGHEYIERPFAYFNIGQGPGGTQSIRIFGDSTATNDYGPTTPTAVIRNALSHKGLPNFVLHNQAVSGSKWTDLDAIPSLADGKTSLIVIKYGINDAAVGGSIEARLAAMRSAMDAKLSAIRAAANGDFSDLAILLVGPNSTSDSPNGRDERWYERIREIYIEMARKHQCGYFDTYGHFSDSRNVANVIMDDPYGDGRSVHPIAQYNARIWGAVVDEFFPQSAIAMFATNRLTNEGSVSSVTTPASLPSQFTNGIFISRAKLADGWPVDGFLITVKNPDGGAVQTLWGYGANMRLLQRTAATASNEWTAWSGQTVGLTLANNWVNQGAPWASPGARKSADGMVVLEGLVTAGIVTAGTVMATLPSGFRPASASLFRVATNGGQCTLSVNPDGTIRAHTAADGTYTSFAGISFIAA